MQPPGTSSPENALEADSHPYLGGKGNAHGGPGTEEIAQRARRDLDAISTVELASAKLAARTTML